MSNKKQSSVEWLLDNLHLQHSTKWTEIVEQAKEIENEQQIAFAKQCLDVASNLDVKTAYSLLDNLDKQIQGGNK